METEKKPWPVRTVEIGRGYGWHTNFLDPNLFELEALQTAFKAGDWPQLKKLMAGLITSWECTEKDGTPLPAPTFQAPEPMDKIPQVVLRDILFGMLQTFLSDPKASGSATESAPTSPPAPAAILMPGAP